MLLHLLADDSEGLFKSRGELCHVTGNFRRLIAHRGQHSFDHFRLGPKDLDGEDNEGEMIIDVVAHLRKLLVQRFNLFWI